MLVSIRYFAAVREAANTSQETIDLPDGASVADALTMLTTLHPAVANHLAAAMVMVNRAYVGKDTVLRAGDELALIPPVSGGTHKRFVVQAEPLDARAVEALVDDPGTGAVVTFIGRVRDVARGQDVVSLDYEAYPEAAEEMMAQIASEIAATWGIEHVAIAHRTGLLGVGEASVVIAVSSPHRAEAFAACQYAIERLKEIVPVWKKEQYRDGAVWIGSEAEYQRETRR